MPPAARSSSSEIHADRGRRRQQRALWRVTAWGSAAAIALIAAALASQTRTGSERLLLAFNGVDQPDNNAAMVATAERRADEAQAETRQLAAKLRELSIDRDRLDTRLAGLEHNLTDITGSISRQAAATKQASIKQAAAKPAPAAAALPIIEPLDMPASRVPLAAWPVPGTQAKPITPPAATSAASAAAAPSAPAATTAAATKQTPAPPPAAAAAKQTLKPLPATAIATQTAKQVGEPAVKPPPTLIQVPLPPVRVATLSIHRPATKKSRPEFAADLGGAMSSKLLRAQWSDVKANFGPRLSRLHAVLAHDRRFGHLPYRLLIGPLPNAIAAARLCAQLISVRHYCRPTHFVGQPLAER